jgi:CRP/FNR family cyclic AMP-dependent transcriptional regulator
MAATPAKPGSVDPELREFLQRTPFFGGLMDAALDRVVAMLGERRFAAGAVVFREGEHGRSMYIVREGTVAVKKQAEGGGAVRLAQLGPGDFFGEMTLIEMQPRVSTIEVVTAATLYELTSMDLLRLYEEDMPSYAMVLLNINRELCRRLRRANLALARTPDPAG